tara:strand:+ start:61 stop:399 length:339 start_codon:yes stop_codon:yes gene_type:complete
MSIRYSNYRILNNSSEYYAPLRKSRGLKNIRHYETPVMQNPSVGARSGLSTTTHIWKYGDRLYKLADEYYNNVSYWWVIAWYNSVPTEAQLRTGNVIRIPLNLEAALKVLGV